MAALLPRAFHPRGVMKSSRIALAAAAAVTLVTSLVSVGTAADAASTRLLEAGLRPRGDGLRGLRRAGPHRCEPQAARHPRARPATRRPSCEAAYGLTGADVHHDGRRSSTPTRNPNAAGDLDGVPQPVRPRRRADTFTQVNQNGGNRSPPVSGNVGWGQEEMLDLEMVSAICPACPILYVGANSASFADLADCREHAAAMGAKVDQQLLRRQRVQHRDHAGQRRTTTRAWRSRPAPVTAATARRLLPRSTR